MTNYYLGNSMRSLLFALTFFTANGQVKTNHSKDSPGVPGIVPGGSVKMVKTQGTDQFANIRCGLQDKSGNLWFGTTGEGVYRFDGNRFTQFTIKDGLSSNTVWCMAEDKAGKLWLGTDAGLCLYDGRNITTVPIIAGPLSNHTTLFSTTASFTMKKSVWSMLQDKTGKLWLATSDGIYFYNGISLVRFPAKDSTTNKSSVHLKSIQYLFEDKKGAIWFGSGASQLGPEGLEGLCRYDGKSITSFKPNGDGWIRYIVEDQSGSIWFGTRHNGIWRYVGNTFTKYTEKTGIGAPLLVDRKGNIWFSGEEQSNGYEGSGVWRYDGKTFTNYTAKDGMGRYSIWTMMEDRSGNLWFGTRNNGLYMYDGKAFTCFSE